MQMNGTVIQSIAGYFKTKPVLRAYLFGSYVRGEAGEQSDIDILVDLDYSKRIGHEFFQMQGDLEKLLNKKVDLVSAEALSKFIKPYVDKEKRLIYEKVKSNFSIVEWHQIKGMRNILVHEYFGVETRLIW